MRIGILQRASDHRIVSSSRWQNLEPLEPRRLLTAGYLDPSFSGDGIAMTRVGEYDRGWENAVQADGKVIVAGADNYEDAILVRFTASGALDGSFGTGGVVRFDLGGDEVFRAVRVLPDGKILAGGRSFTPGSQTAWLLVRYTADGKLDTSFGGGDGIQTGNGDITAMALQDSGIITAGSGIIRRHDASTGALDTTFGSGNGSQSLIDGTTFITMSVADLDIQDDGRIIVTGTSAKEVEPTDEAAVVIRLTEDGAFDTTFNGDGLYAWEGEDPFGDDRAAGAAIQPGGKIVLAANTDSFPFLVRLNPDGHVDPSWPSGGGGESNDGFTYDFGSGNSWQDEVFDIQVQPDGKIVTVNSAELHLDNLVGVARFNADGSFDTGFAGDGKSVFKSSGSQSLALAPGGQILVAGGGFSASRLDGTGAVPTPGKVFMEGTMLTIEGNNADNEMEAGQYADIALFVRIDTYSDVVSLDGVERVRVRGMGGNDHIIGESMTGDTLAGGSGNDVVEDRSGRGNVLYGESGDDVLNSSGGNDSVYGNDGDDTLVSDNLTTSPGHGDLFYGSAGTDTIDYTSRTENLRISLDGIANDGEAGESDNVMFDIERVLSGSGDDYLVGNGAANVLYGGGGNDILDGQGGNDALFGQSGHDILSGRDGNDRLDGGSGSDSLYGQSGFDTLLGQDGNDVLFGLGDGSVDLLDGGSGSDWARKDPADSAISIEHYF